MEALLGHAEDLLLGGGQLRGAVYASDGGRAA